MKIVSIVAILEMENIFNLNELLDKVPGTEPCLTWVQMRFSINNRHIAFYKSGKIRISGVKSDEELILISDKLLSFLEKHGIQNKIKQININNYVLVDKMDNKVNLDILAKNLLEYDVTYEPEQFPALHFKDENNITFMLFSSGKMNITGVKSLENLEEKVNSFKQLVMKKS